MIHDEYPSIALHNVAATETPDWTPSGDQLVRVPLDVLPELNVGARERMHHPAGCELRFVPETASTRVSVTLSAAEEIRAWPFWGDFQEVDPIELGPTPQTFDFSVPERVADLRPEAREDATFDPRVCRLRFEATVPAAVHDVSGACRPPTEHELPETRYLAYGTSITEGFYASAAHLSYVAQAARQLEVDAVNLGAAGSAYCDPAITEHIAGRDDWEFATLALSVNMTNRGFTLEQFRDRAADMVDTVAAAHPNKPIVCITLYPFFADAVRGEDQERATAFRETLRTIVEETDYPNVSLLDGRSAMDIAGLTADCLHPSDAGMADIGRQVVAALDAVRE